MLFWIWTFELGENRTVNHNPKVISTYSQSFKKALVKKHSVLLVLDTLTTLLDMSNFELADVSIDRSDIHNVVQVLPAPVKRCLATLRIKTKWIYSSLDYIYLCLLLFLKILMLRASLFARFWEYFAEFLNAIEKSFPHYQGIPLDIPLREDFELNRFLILKNHISVDKNALADQKNYLKS